MKMLSNSSDSKYILRMVYIQHTRSSTCKQQITCKSTATVFVKLKIVFIWCHLVVVSKKTKGPDRNAHCCLECFINKTLGNLFIMQEMNHGRRVFVMDFLSFHNESSKSSSGLMIKYQNYICNFKYRNAHFKYSLPP